MIELIIGLCILGFGISLCLCLNETFEFFGILTTILSVIFLMMHIPIWLSSAYRYEMHIVKRNSFIERAEIKKPVHLGKIDLEKFNKPKSNWENADASV